MNKLVIAMVGCAVLVAFAVPAVAQDPTEPEVYPEVDKMTFDHDGNVPGTPDGTTGQPQTVPWWWHPQPDPNDPVTLMPNVAGIKFTLKYDPYEVDILGITPMFGSAGAAGDQHWRLEPLPDQPGVIGPTPPSDGQPAEPNVLPGRLAGTIFLPSDLAKESGMDVQVTNKYHIFDLHYQPKHTSHADDPRFNSEVDIKVSELRPILHPPGGIHDSVWRSEHIPEDDPAGPLKASDILWTHMNGVQGVFLPNSARYFTSQAASSNLQQNPVSGHHVSAVIRPSHWVHPLDQPIDLHMVNSEVITLDNTQLAHVPGTVQLSGIVVPTSVYVVGEAVGGVHTGLGIDHVPEPVSLMLLATGGVCLLVHASIRRRRRRAA